MLSHSQLRGWERLLRYNVIMEETPSTLDPDRQLLARSYARIRRRLWAAKVLLNGLYLGLWVGLGGATRVLQVLTPLTSGGNLIVELPWWVDVVWMTLFVFTPWILLSIPLDFYSSFVLPHRYGLSTQTLRGWLSDLVKGGILAVLLGLPLIVLFYSTLRLNPTTWWLLAAGGYTLITAVLTSVAPVLLMPIFFKFKPLKEEHRELAERLIRLAQDAGTRVQGVFTFDMSRRTRAANAALVGLGRTRRILLGDTLLAEFPTDEIETILAHELAHHVHRDVLFSLVIQGLLSLITFYITSLGLDWSVAHSGLTGSADPAGLPTLALLLNTLSVMIMPFANAYSRWRESMADDYALEITRKSGAFASAMTRLANQNLAEADPERWVVLLLYSHPPLRSRIEKAHRFPAISA